MPVEEAVQYIRGKEKTKVTLSVLPGSKGRGAVPVRITLTRAKILLTESEAHGKVFVAGGKKVGLINLPSFYMDFDGALRGDANFKRCSEDVRKILTDFRKEGVQAVVMDLRRNGGGSLAEAVALTGLFIPTGPVVQRRDSQRRVTLAVDEDSAVEWEGPRVIMISKLSASAAEIFTAALRDCDRAVVVGDSRTFGKGTVLQVEKLQEGFSLFGPGRRDIGSVTFEIEMFYRISGSSVQQLGIRSDVRIPSISEAMNEVASGKTRLAFRYGRRSGAIVPMGSAAKCDIRASYRAPVPETAPSRRKRFRRPALLRSPESGRHAAAALQRNSGVNILTFRIMFIAR